jgi:predicted RNase H-like HicB family nuclease
MKDQNQPVLSFTGVMIQDPETKGYTAYFAEFPEVIAQGDDTASAKENLLLAFKSMIEFKTEEAKEEYAGDDTIITENYPFSFS